MSGFMTAAARTFRRSAIRRRRRISFTFTRSIDPYETFYYFVPKSGPRSPSPPNPLLGYINLLY